MAQVLQIRINNIGDSAITGTLQLLVDGCLLDAQADEQPILSTAPLRVNSTVIRRKITFTVPAMVLPVSIPLCLSCLLLKIDNHEPHPKYF